MVNAPAIIVLGPSGLDIARRLKAVLPGAEIHGARARLAQADAGFDTLPEHLRTLFAGGRDIIGVCATGILMRALGPCLTDKRNEPAVVAVSEDGSAVVPLLGGHRGANALAQRLAAELGISAAITTAGDVRFGVALDAPPLGWLLANPNDAKPVMAALLAGAKARIEGHAPWLNASSIASGDDGTVELIITDRPEKGGPGKLVFHPKTLALGVGCERGCQTAELIELVERTLTANGLSSASIALVASVDLKADEAAVLALADHLHAPARFYAPDELNKQAPRLKNPSELVMAEIGCPGVAEGGALAAVGSHGELIVEKTKSRRATCAVGRAPAPIDPQRNGRSRGSLAIVGIGPGDAAWRSPEASALLGRATDWVGYRLYLDLVSDISGDARMHRFDLGEEEARAAHALKLAGEGRDVALVCSGDAGIYSMASLVYELLDPDRANGIVGDSARRAEIIVAPGISALQAAAARAGAPLGHDFCSISLSDLLTPWAQIERRLIAAAEADFVVALYNPKSKRRTRQIETAMDILGGHRPPETPVIVATNLGRDQERVLVSSLAEFDPETVNMLTVVIVGSSTTRLLTSGGGERRVYTPRGYEAKRGET